MAFLKKPSQTSSAWAFWASTASSTASGAMSISKLTAYFLNIAILPYDVFDTILEYVKPSLLAKLARVSRAFYELAIPHLYRYIFIHHPHRELSLYITLTQHRPEYARYIREFRRANTTNVCCNPSGICHGSEALARSLYGNDVPGMQAMALSGAVNMVSLEVAMGPPFVFADSNGQYSEVANLGEKNNPFKNVRYLLDGKIKLKHLIVHGLPNSVLDGPDWTCYMRTILKAQPSLQHIDIGIDSILQFTLTYLPCLKSFKGNGRSLPLSASRPLQSIGIRETSLGDLGDRIKEIQRVQGGGSVLRFEWSSAAWGLDVLWTVIPQTFPNLEVFKLELWHSYGGRVTFFQELARWMRVYILPQCTKLVEIDLGGTRYSDGTNYQLDIVEGEEAERKLAEAWASGCPTLRHLVLPNDQYWFKSDSGFWVKAAEPRRDHWVFYKDSYLPGGGHCVAMSDVMFHP